MNFDNNLPFVTVALYLNQDLVFLSTRNILCLCMLVSLSCTASFSESSEKQETALAIVSQDQNKFAAQGLAELRRYQEKYEKNWLEKPAHFPWSVNGSIKVFQLVPDLGNQFENRLTEGVLIEQQAFQELIDIIRDPLSYGGYIAGCFSPRFGLVAYDDAGVPMEFMSICIQCGNYRTVPGKIDVDLADSEFVGFSAATKMKLVHLFEQWGIAGHRLGRHELLAQYDRLIRTCRSTEELKKKSTFHPKKKSLNSP